MKLELKGITKSFGTFTANDQIDLMVEAGEVHCLLGENGAGKSTLMNVIFGLYEPTSGSIEVDGQPVTFNGPGDAMAAGIGMVHQHFMLIPVFTVAENVALGNEATGFGGILDLETTRRRIREISERYGFRVDPDALVEDLPVGVQQRVEIIKALVRDADTLILDEPTAVLTPQETDELIEIIGQLKAAGKGIVFISHKLREVKAVADRITVIRRGRIVGTAEPSASAAELADLMVGRAVSLTLDKAAPQPGEHTLRVRNLTVLADDGSRLLDDVSFSVAQGEILAIAGVQGNGQTELAEALIGLQQHVFGSIQLEGQELVGRSVRQIISSGVGFVPEDRSVDGLIGEFSIEENLILNLYRDPEFAAAGTLRRQAIAEHAQRKIEEFDVRTPSASAAVSTLSGGNQQKVVLARELSRPLKLFIASQPTRGVDVGSIEFLHRRIIAERDQGTPIVIVSTELEEVAELADRIAVLHSGQVMGIVPGDTGRDLLGLMMAGMSEAEARAQLSGTASSPPVIPAGPQEQDGQLRNPAAQPGSEAEQSEAEQDVQHD